MKQFYLGENEQGISYFEDREIGLKTADFAPPAPALLASDIESATGVLFLTLPAGWGGARHRSPHRQILFCLSGELLVEAGDGSSRKICAGDIWRMEDTAGTGHTTTVTSPGDMRAAIVQLA